MTPVRRPLALLAALVAVGLAGCGGGGGDGGGPDGRRTTTTPPEPARGGTLTVVSGEDPDSIDPGVTYEQQGFQLAAATHRSLYAYEPGDVEDAKPDLADGEPEVDEDGERVTVRLKEGVRFAPPINREVTSADVKYAIERGFFTSVANGYAASYFGDVVGARDGVRPGTEVRGITTPDERTIRFQLRRPSAVALVGALALPLSAPVPPEVARRRDEAEVSTYDRAPVATGPYMVEADPRGRVTGYDPGRELRLVRNPGWDRDSDDRPAHVDAVRVQLGNDDAALASRRILDGQALVSGSVVPPPATLRQAASRPTDQLQLVDSGGTQWVSLNTAIKPFDDLDVRKAVVAGFDREAMRLTQGGAAIGAMPTHFLPPGVPGHEEAGGARGPDLDFLGQPRGDPSLSGEYFRAAGFDSGRYEPRAGEELLLVGEDGGVERQAAEVAVRNLRGMGFRVRARFVSREAMYSRFCGVPRAEVAVCPNLGYARDFQDPETFLDPAFNGENIAPRNNVNWSQLDVRSINDAMASASEVVDPDEKARAWGAIDRMVTEQAPAIPWLWPKQPLLRSRDVLGEVHPVYAAWDLARTAVRSR